MHDRRNPPTGAAASEGATRPSSSAGDAVTALARASDDYPLHLRAVPASPPTLYVRGRIVPDDALAVAVVGARRPTAYGLEVAEQLGFALAARGVTVVSGLARGIDSAAHRGALASGGRTIAVLGSGVDVIYPPENRRLAGEIAARGALVSQFAPGTPPLPYRFPERNRVIAAMSLAVVVVEAAERSGALITAGCAAELGREVLAVPGRVTSPESRGAHRLIQDGAGLVQDVDDVIRALPARWQACVKAPARPAAARTDARPGVERGDGGRVLEVLGDEPVTIDDVIERSGLPPGRATALLLELELAGRVRQLDGKQFVRTIAS
jgi:DNA processing protein